MKTYLNGDVEVFPINEIYVLFHFAKIFQNLFFCCSLHFEYFFVGQSLLSRLPRSIFKMIFGLLVKHQTVTHRIIRDEVGYVCHESDAMVITQGMLAV